MNPQEFQELNVLVGNSLHLHDDHIHVQDEAALRADIRQLARAAALGSGKQAAQARWLIRSAAQALGILPASIHDLYMARGRGEVPPAFTVPAMNLRILTFDAAAAIFRNALKIEAGAFLFEIARSEIGYTQQRPSEYSACVLAAAIATGWRGPVFIQGDHFQVSASRYRAGPDAELEAVKDLTAEAVAAGFYNIDVDTSTLVEIEKPTIPEQQELNSRLSAEMTAFIRALEPQGVTVSIGGEIGEVGGHNSNEAELRAYTEGFDAVLEKLAPGRAGLSKISIQTGTSHGGTVLPDGSIAQVSVDFETMLALSRIARMEYGMAGAVQHGASTLPQEAFGKFVEYEACEVHLATNFQNIFFDLAPKELLDEMYAYLDANHAKEKKEGQTAEQFYYKTRKYAIGPFKARQWDLPAEQLDAITRAWDEQFAMLFEKLAIAGTRQHIEAHVHPAEIAPDLNGYLKAAGVGPGEDTSDLAD
ncbi:MAG: class II fructose-bisphosphate aldolase [Chloroflexi bacterium]|nr:class II fructose-bisphosphate aldolase [Chloroflexota bacterium]